MKRRMSVTKELQLAMVIALLALTLAACAEPAPQTTTTWISPEKSLQTIRLEPQGPTQWVERGWLKEKGVGTVSYRAQVQTEDAR